MLWACSGDIQQVVIPVVTNIEVMLGVRGQDLTLPRPQLHEPDRLELD